MKLRIAALLSLTTTAVHGACDICDGFDDSLKIDTSFMAGMGMGMDSGDEAPDGMNRARLLQALDGDSDDGSGFFPETCAEMRAIFAETPDGECAMIALLAYKSCGCTGDPPPGSCYICPDGSPVPDLEASPAPPAGMEIMDSGEEMEVPETCGDLAFTTSFSALLFDTMAEAFGAMGEGMGGIDEGHGDCVPVNHIHDHPGHVTCDCVAPENPCLGDGYCVLDDSCAGSHGGDVATDNMALDMDIGGLISGPEGDLVGALCAMVGLMCDCPQPDVPELSSTAETETAATSAAIVPDTTSSTAETETAATSAAIVPDTTSPAETAATTETPANAPNAPGPDEDPNDSGAGPLGLFVVTLMVAVGTISLA